MKIRTDFVTNSSSSSFILAFKDESTMVKELLDDYTGGELETILRDVLNADNHRSKEEILEEYRDYAEWEIRWSAHNYFQRKLGLNWSDSYDYCKEHPDEVEEYTQKKLNEAMKELEDNLDGMGLIAMVEYEDHTEQGSRLEHEIVPHMKSCKAVLNNH